MAKILVAEDERDIRDLVAFTLRFAGHEVVVATNGQEAVEMAPHENPDLILMDVRMPRMTGFEFVHALKRNERTREKSRSCVTRAAALMDSALAA